MRNAAALLLAIYRSGWTCAARDGRSGEHAGARGAMDSPPWPGRRDRTRRIAGACAGAGDAVAVRESEHGAARSVEPEIAGAGERALRGAARSGAPRRWRPVLPFRARVRGRAQLLARAPRDGGAIRAAGTRLRRSRISLANSDGESRGAARTGGHARGDDGVNGPARPLS